MRLSAIGFLNFGLCAPKRPNNDCKEIEIGGESGEKRGNSPKPANVKRNTCTRTSYIDRSITVIAPS